MPLPGAVDDIAQIWVLGIAGVATIGYAGFLAGPVIGVTKISHLESAVESLSVQLTPEDVAYLEEPYIPHPIVGLNPCDGQLLRARR